jgi:phospholipid/cholesterol/gamma-HCH transport system substrate-binding protein
MTMISGPTMQRYTRLEISVGLFVMIGVVALAYLSFTLGGLELTRGKRYTLVARFSSVGGLKVGDPVKLAGVSVGEVASLKVVDFAAQADLALEEDMKLPEDTIASIQSTSLLGDMYVSMSPGASEKVLVPGALITRTTPAISLTELIAKYAFGSPIADPGEARGDKGRGGSDSKHSPFANPVE